MHYERDIPRRGWNFSELLKKKKNYKKLSNKKRQYWRYIPFGMPGMRGMAGNAWNEPGAIWQVPGYGDTGRRK
jgi:hypothetical protein